MKEGEYIMINFIYGAVTTATVVKMIDVIDTNVPNNLWYYVDTYLF